jgi:hypothetical protein
VGHFPAAELELDADLVATVEKFFAVADLGQIIVIVDVDPELDFLQLRAGRSFVLAKFSECDDFTDWRVGSRRDLDQIEIQTLSFAQGIGELHDA